MAAPAAKRARTSELALVASEAAPEGAAAADEAPRTSNLFAPIMLLTGHEGAVYTARYNPDGTMLASSGHEKTIFLWDNLIGDCRNFNVLQGHKRAVTQLCWTGDGEKLATSSADKTVGLWDVKSGKRTRKLTGHNAYVNAVDCTRRGDALVVSAGDDGCAMVWDARNRPSEACVGVLDAGSSTLAAVFGDAGDTVMTGGIDNVVHVWDLRKQARTMLLEGHSDTVTGLAVSPDGTKLLSNSMEGSIGCWDISPFAQGSRLLKKFVGASHNFEKNLLRCAWSHDAERVSGGCATGTVHVWDVPSGEELYTLGGHIGSVNEVTFHPTEPIVLSCSNDKQIYLGEIQPSA